MLMIRYACLACEIMIMNINEIEKLICNPDQKYLGMLFQFFEQKEKCPPLQLNLVCRILLTFLQTKRKKKVYFFAQDSDLV